MSWGVYEDVGSNGECVLHVAPTDEKDKHINSTECECFPKVIVDVDRIIVVHRSYDGREGLEEANKILNQSCQ